MNHTEQRARQALQARSVARRMDAEMDADSDVAPRRARSILGASGSRLPRSDGDRRGNIMVIEHDLATRETLALMLRYYGYEVTVAGDSSWTTQSTVPTSMPISSEEVATMARNSPPLSLSSTARRRSSESDP